MNFASFDFWRLLALCFVGSQLLMALAKTVSADLEKLVGKLCLAATGLILLGSESWLTLAVFLWVVSLSWIGILVACRPGFNKSSLASRLIFIVLLTGQLAPLFYYKYWTFVLNDWLGLGVKQPSVFIPMGLSFYTFQKIGFWIDTVRNPGSRPKLLDYLNFCSFFPQIVAGPIEKKASLLPQIETVNFRIHRANIDPALRWIVLGLAYKMVIADNLGVIPHHVQINPSNPYHIWLEIFTFSMRIYFDFAGYSFIAVGLGLILGVRLTLNFRCPYWSASVREYWRTWHVTLGAWLREYIYLPLGGRKPGRWMINTLIVLLVSGIWHGAGWGFLIWGLLHGIAIICCSPGKEKKLPWAVRWFVTFIFITITRLFFMETNNSRLFEKTLTFFNPLSYNLSNLKSLPSAFNAPINALSLSLILAISFVALLAEGLGIRKNKEPYHYCRVTAATIFMVFLIVFLAPMEESRFIYFNF
jgi:alginate O-acetyltransferase complex protein AlgI